MPAVVTAPAPRLEKKKHCRTPPTAKKGVSRSNSDGSSRGSPYFDHFTHTDLDQSELSSAVTTMNGAETVSFHTAGSNTCPSAGSPSLASTGRTGGTGSPNAANMILLSPEMENCQRGAPRDATINLSSSGSAASYKVSPPNAAVPVVHKDPSPTSKIIQATAPTKVPHRRVNSQLELAPSQPMPILKRPPPSRRTSASQPAMFSTSPPNKSLERGRTPSPQRPAAAAPAKPQKAMSKSVSAEAVVAKAEKKRTPSPQPQKPHSPKKQSTLTPSAAAAPAPVVAHGAAHRTPSPQPAEPKRKRSAASSAAATPTTGKGPAMPSHSPAAVSAPAPAPAAKNWSPSMNTHESPETLPTDEPNLVVPARKYAYDTKTCTWKEVDTMIRVLHPNRGVSQGAMRVCFVVEELDERGFSTPMVAKMFRHNLDNIMQADYFNEGEAQCICGIFAEKYNKVELPKNVDRFVVSFLQCDTVRIRLSDIPEKYQNKRTGFFSYRPTDTRDLLFTMEPRLKGNFTKYTNNFGDVYEGFEQRLDVEKEAKRHKVLMAVEAFSHFTLEDSGHSMLVCDLQGVNDFLTDPQIHTVDGKGLGMGNMGQEGIDKWVEKHVCNDMCRAAGLKPLKGPLRGAAPKKDNVDTRISYYKILRANLRSAGPTRPEDLIPLPKPLADMTDEERLQYAISLSKLLS